MTRVLFDVNITNDRLLEINETFKLRINCSSLPNRVIVTSPNETTITIIDNDCKLLTCLTYCSYMIIIITVITIRFNQSSYNVDENSGVIQPVLIFRRRSSTNITVQVRDNSSTATGE